MITDEKTPEISIESEMKKSYLDYAMSVIIGRALPDVRDGLKPVHRRVLFAMQDLRNDFNKPYKKSARIVGDCFVKGTLVHTESGLSPIEEIEIGQEVLLPDGSLSLVNQVFHNKLSEIVRVKMSDGYTFEVTPGQLFRVLNDDLTIGWEKAENLEGRTVLVSNHRVLGDPAPHPEPDKSALAYIVGLETSESKQVPKWILQDRRLFAPFLAGFSDGDGYFRFKDSKREVILTSASRLLLVQIQAMLADSGIHCTLTCEDFKDKAYGEGHLNRYNLWIAGEQASLFCSLIKNFLKIEKKRRSATDISQWSKRTLSCSYECVPGRTIFEELSERHLGSGWYQDKNGRKFRAGIKYPGGSKIRYEKNLVEKDISYRQIQEWGILAKLERIGSDIAPRLKHLIDTYCLVQVESVEKTDERIDTYDIRIDSPEHEFMVHGFAVHNCIGKYHPHGDTAVYDTIVRMAQNFSLRYPLVDGQGNFGSIDGDSPAAMRYTEIRMSKIAHQMLEDLDKDTVDFVPNYDESLSEPSVLPAKIPDLLINGSSGIAVGMATNIPPHNLSETVDALIALIDNPDLDWQQLAKIIPGPDFPTAGIIYGTGGIYEAYSTGRGIIKIRARAMVEEDKKTGMETIVVTELPYQVNKARLIEKIAELMKEKQLDGVRYVRDESDRDGMRIAVALKKDQVAEVVLNQLYKHTQMENSFGIIFLAIVNNRPRLLTLKEILEYFIRHRKDIITRRTRYDLRKAEERAHILEGLKIALENLDNVVALIRASKTAQDAKIQLGEQFNLTVIQSQAILEMRLQRLTGLEQEKILEEYQTTLKDIAWFKEILSDEQVVLRIIKDELTEIRSAFGDNRRTEIVESTKELTIADMIVEEDMVVTISKDGYIKRNPITLYQSQRRGGKGKMAMGTKEEDFVERLFIASTHHTFLFFTNKGKVYWCKVYDIPQASRTSRGKAIVNLLNFEDGERLTTVLAVPAFAPGHHIIMATRSGIIKKTELMAYSRPRSGGIIAINLTENDELIAARITDGTMNVFLGSSTGKAIRFHESDVRPTGRAAQGVKGMNIDDDDYIVAMEVLSHGQTLFAATENGFGKRTSIDEYPVQRRGGKGVITIKTTQRNGKVVVIVLVEEDDDLMLMTDSGKLIRIPVKGVSVISRNTQGVKLMNREANERIIGAVRLAEKEEEGETVEEVPDGLGLELQ